LRVTYDKKNAEGYYEITTPYTDIEMVPCSQMTTEQFQPGGIWYADLVEGNNGDSHYCPVTGDIDYVGVIGTNVWVVPKEYILNESGSVDANGDPNEYTIDDYVNTNIDCRFHSRYFNVENYMAGDESMVPTYTVFDSQIV
jgi:hypothetical protein